MDFVGLSMDDGLISLEQFLEVVSAKKKTSSNEFTWKCSMIHVEVNNDNSQLKFYKFSMVLIQNRNDEMLFSRNF